MNSQPRCAHVRRSVAPLAFFILSLSSPVVSQDREVRVTTSEGTNIAAALSPDGQTIAIDLQGTLWILPAAGGEARPISDELSDARQPAWAPDGSRIAFQSFRDGNWHVWTIGPDGHDVRQHTFGPFDDREPHWSHDGRRIVFSSDRSGNYDIWTLDLESGAIEQLTTDPASDFTPAWSPDDRLIAFVSTRSNAPGIWLRAADGSERLVTGTEGSASAPSWSPDGNRLVYNVIGAGESRLLVVDITRAGRNDDSRIVSEDGADVFPFRASWTSATEFIYTADGKLQRGSVSSQSAHPIEFQATFAFTRRAYRRNQRDFDSTDPQPVRGVFSPAVSPGGDRIAFAALGDLWVSTIETGELQQLTDDPYMELHPSWSRDGSRLVFASDRAGTLDLWIREMETGVERPLTDLPGAEVTPVWSPDGSRVAFRTEAGLGGDVRVVDVASGQVRVLRDDLFAPSRPSWSADGSTLAMSVLTPYSSRFREGRNEVLPLPADGGEGGGTRVTALPHRGMGTRGLDGPVWSPDGTKWAFVAEGVLWTVEVDAQGVPNAPPKRLTSHPVAGALSWTGDSKSIVYQTTDGLRRLHLEDGRTEEIPVNLRWRRYVPDEVIVIHAGRVFDGRSEAVRTDVDIVIEGHRVREVVPHDQSVHRGRVIDAGDQTVMPGLIDMHSHLGYGFGEALGRVWLSYGVTTIRDPSSDPYAILERREAVESGARIGPREFATGHIFDGTRIYYSGALSLDRGAQVGMELEQARTLEYDLIKTYVRLPDLLQKRIIEYAHANGIPVSSHEIYPAVALGADHVEHLRGTSRRGYSPKITALSRSYDDVVQLVAQSGMTITPTIGIQGGFNVVTGRDPAILDDPRLALFPAPVIAATRQRLTRPRRQSNIEPQGDTVRRIVNAGGRVVAGTDSPIIPYGLSLHTELEHYVDGGLTPFQALQTATVAAAAALGASGDLGAIGAGMVADLVVVHGNPLDDIKDTRRVRLVIKNGEVFTLDELLRRPLVP